MLHLHPIMLLLAETGSSEQYVLQLLDSYGPIIVFLALLAPLFGEETIIIPAGVAIGNGHVPAFATWLCAFVGVVCSDSIWYWLCYVYGTPLLHKRWFKRTAHPRRLLQAKHQMEKRGAWVIVFGRFLPGSRTAAVVMAGLLHMPPWKYYITECICALATVSLQIGVGWYIASHVANPSLFGTFMTILAVVVGFLLLSFLAQYLYSRRKKAQRSPRAKASWLRKFRGPRALLDSKTPLAGRMKGSITGSSHTP